MLDVGRRVVRAKDHETEGDVADHQRHQAEVSIAHEHVQFDFVVRHLDHLFSGFERELRKRRSNIRHEKDNHILYSEIALREPADFLLGVDFLREEVVRNHEGEGADGCAEETADDARYQG